MAIKRLKTFKFKPESERQKPAPKDFTEVILQDIYTVGEILGQGTNAKVFKAMPIETRKSRRKKNSPPPKPVAVKVMKTKDEIMEENKGKSSAINEERLFRHEMDTMMLIKSRLPDHPNLITLITVCTSADPESPQKRPCFVLEFLPGGELFDKIVERSYFTESDAAQLFFTLMVALKDLHGAGIVHRDLKPENLIFGENENDIKICDFGTAKVMDEESPDIFAEFKVGSPGYFAPETIYKQYHRSNDVWSMGCILYTLLVGYMPFDMDDPMLMVKLITCKFEFHEDAWKNITDDAKDLITQMLSMPYKERITAEDVLKHKWFRKQKRRPSQANLQETLAKLKELNDAKEKKRHIMREYFFQNVLSARSKMTELISNSAKMKQTVQSGLRRIASRGSMSGSLTNDNVALQHTRPKNRQDMLSDIRTRKKPAGMAEVSDLESGEVPRKGSKPSGPTLDVRGRSNTSFSMAAMSNVFSMLTKSNKGKKSKNKKPVKEPKNVQAMLSEIRTQRQQRLGPQIGNKTPRRTQEMDV